MWKALKQMAGTGDEANYCAVHVDMSPVRRSIAASHQEERRGPGWTVKG